MRKQNLEFSLEKCVRPAGGGAGGEAGGGAGAGEEGGEGGGRGGEGDANATVVSWKGVQQAGEAAGFLLAGWSAGGQSRPLIGRLSNLQQRRGNSLQRLGATRCGGAAKACIGDTEHSIIIIIIFTIVMSSFNI